MTATAPTQQDETATSVVMEMSHEETFTEESTVKELSHQQQQEQQKEQRQQQQHDVASHYATLLTQAEALYQEDRLSQVAKILKSIPSNLWTDPYRAMFQRAQEAEILVQDLKSQPEEGSWIDQGVSGGKFPTRILYRLEEPQQSISTLTRDSNNSDNDGNDDGSNGNNSTVKLRARCETPIPKDLLEPLLSVLNETELYETWLPSFRVPKFQVRQCKKLKQSGRVSQILLVTMDLPWPMSAREVVLSAAAFDAIEEDGHIGIQLKTIDVDQDPVVPEVDGSTVRVDVDGGFLFQACPQDHPAMQEYKNIHNEHSKKISNHDENEDNDDDQYILVTFSAVMDPHMKLLPQSFLNFLVKTALGTAWKMLLNIAQDVKDGKRPDHASAIERKRQEVYDYVQERVQVMLSLIQEQGQGQGQGESCVME